MIGLRIKKRGWKLPPKNPVGIPKQDDAGIDTSIPDEDYTPRTIRQWRELRGLSRDVLARQLETNVSTIQHWETGRKVNPSATLYRALAQALQVPMEAIILPSDEDTPPDSPTPPRGQ